MWAWELISFMDLIALMDFYRISSFSNCASVKSDVINLALDQEGALCIPQSDKDVELVQGAKGAKEVSEGKKQTSLTRGPIQ